MAEEKVFYSDEEGVRVTNTRFIVGSTTYPISGITSVTTGKIPAKRSPAIWTIIIGLLITIFGFSLNATMGLIGVIILAIGVAWLFTLKYIYVLKITTSAGETDALKTKGNSDYIQNVARALNEAIIQKG